MGREFRKARDNTPGPDGGPLTQETLIELAEIKKAATVSRLENGQRPHLDTHNRLLKTLNDLRRKAGLSPVTIEFSSDEERRQRVSPAGPRMQEGYWVEKIRRMPTQTIDYSLAYLYRIEGRWNFTGWSSLGPQETWYSNGYHFDDGWRNFYYTYGRGRGLSTQGAVSGFGGIHLSPVSKGQTMRPVSGWFVNLSAEGATVYECTYLTLSEAARGLGRSKVPGSAELEDEIARTAFLAELVQSSRGIRPAPSGSNPQGAPSVVGQG